MSCSLQTYRARIGLFQPTLVMKPCASRAPSTSKLMSSHHSRNFQLVLCLLLLITSSVQYITPSDQFSKQGPAHGCTYAWMGAPTPSLGTDILFPDKQDLYNVWDPGINPPPAPVLTAACSSYVCMADDPVSMGITGAAAFPWIKVKPVSEADVLKLITNLKSSFATGVDHIDTRTVKPVADLFASPLAHIINLSVSSSIYQYLS